jgi:hypothetical protein
VGLCELTVYNPVIVAHSDGSHTMHNAADVECPPGYLEASVTADLFRNGAFINTASDSEFGYAPYAKALGGWKCVYNTAANFYTRGLGYAEDDDGTAYTGARNSGTVAHHC